VNAMTPDRQDRQREPDAPGCILVAIGNPRTVTPLMRLAATLSDAGATPVMAAHIVTVPRQMALSSARSSSEVARGAAVLRDAIIAAEAAGVDADGIVNIGRSVVDGLASAVDSRNADILLIGWSEDTEAEGDAGAKAFDKLMHHVASAISCDLLVAKFRSTKSRTGGAERVLVPVAASRHMPLVARAVRRLAAAGSEISFLHVVPAEAAAAHAHDDVVALLEEHGLADLGSLEVVVAEDAGAEVIARTTGFDLVVIGAVRKAALAEALFGSKAETIAGQAACSVLVARAAD